MSYPPYGCLSLAISSYALCSNTLSVIVPSRFSSMTLSHLYDFSRPHPSLIPPSLKLRLASYLGILFGPSWSMLFIASFSTWISIYPTIPLPSQSILLYMVYIIICPWIGKHLNCLRIRHTFTNSHSLRLVMPPALFAALSFPFTQLAHVVFPAAMANGVIAGAFVFCRYLFFTRSVATDNLVKMSSTM